MDEEEKKKKKEKNQIMAWRGGEMEKLGEAAAEGEWRRVKE